jgi:hypothetical protein
MSQPTLLVSLEQLLFDGPLYAIFTLNSELQHFEVLYRRLRVDGRWREGKVDGYCPYCKRDSTFAVTGMSVPDGDPWKNIKQRYAFDNMYIACVRDEDHIIRYNFLVKNATIMKVGQHPSVADIAIDETRQKFRAVLRGRNWEELYKAIGLAAHGEGIGSFVYLRRVFERLIRSRFDEFKTAEGWADEDFSSRRMDEKVALLKDHLPSYLVEIRRIYSIFSQGIHELENEECLQFFDVGKRSIVLILEDDLKKQEELAARKELASAVAKFSPNKTESNGA